ncbi:MAG: hypothetical protein ACRDFA_08585 [bacterium]
MSSHFSTIGFPVRNMEEYWTLARRAAEAGVRNVAADGSALVRWAVDSGPEIWSNINRAGDVVGAIPFFTTGNAYRIAVTGLGDDPDEEMEGWIDGWLEPSEDDEPFSGAFPLRASLVNYALARSRLGALPSVHRMELVALAHEADLFADDEAYARAPGEIYRVPVGSFTSSAHFAADDDDQAFSEATALLTGRIGSARLLANPATSASFWWVQVAVRGVTLHTFADRETLGGEPLEGQILGGSFWLLGRLL